jgi:hypothetical protein
MKPLSTTTLTHLGFLAVIASYLALSYPVAVPALALQFGCALAGELLVGWWSGAQRLVVVREACFLGGLAAAWFLQQPIYPLVGYALCASLLLLVRTRALRYLPALVAADLIWCSVGGVPPSLAPLPAATAACFLVPLALSALAADAWLAASLGAKRIGRPLAGRWSGLAVPVLLSAAVGLVVGLPAAHRSPQDFPVQPLHLATPGRAAKAHAGLADVLRVGDQLKIDNDQSITARLEWNGAAPRLGRMVYLRAICLPQVVSDGAFLLWRASDAGFTPYAAPVGERVPSGWLLRRPGSGDAVLRPDGCSGVGLSPLVRDRDDNWYQAGLGRQQTTYRVSLDHLVDAELGEALVGEVEACRRLPRDISGLPWNRIEQAHWSDLTGEDAAHEIIAVIQGRCSYELEHLPEPDPSPCGALRTFLFADDRDERRGHCQYFSTAAVVMLRRAGHPARTVVGFASEEIDAKGVTFRGIHAHAWLEVVNSRGRWQRFDATPAAGYLARQALFNPVTAEPAPQVQENLPPAPDAAALADERQPLPGVPLSARWLWRLAIGAAFIAVGGWWWWRQRPSRADQRLRAAERADEPLLACAREFGVPIRPSTTISVLAEQLGQRAGIDLSSYLESNLKHRYGLGGRPQAWPVAQLRSALRAQQRAQQQICEARQQTPANGAKRHSSTHRGNRNSQ